MISLRLWSKLSVVRKYSIRAGSVFKIKIGQLGFDNFKPLKLHVAYSTKQNVRGDGTLGKGTSDTFNNKPRYQLQILKMLKLHGSDEQSTFAWGIYNEKFRVHAVGSFSPYQAHCFCPCSCMVVYHHFLYVLVL
jgi:hypothetical protein